MNGKKQKQKRTLKKNHPAPGSKLEDADDIQRRKNIATGKLVLMKKILRRKKIRNTQKKVKLYSASKKCLNI